jgi:hypothetical protein
MTHRMGAMSSNPVPAGADPVWQPNPHGICHEGDQYIQCWLGRDVQLVWRNAIGAATRAELWDELAVELL